MASQFYYQQPGKGNLGKIGLCKAAGKVEYAMVVQGRKVGKFDTLVLSEGNIRLVSQLGPILIIPEARIAPVVTKTVVRIGSVETVLGAIRFAQQEGAVLNALDSESDTYAVNICNGQVMRTVASTDPFTTHWQIVAPSPEGRFTAIFDYKCKLVASDQ